jgi:hypothetical protein
MRGDNVEGGEGLMRRGEAVIEERRVLVQRDEELAARSDRTQ